ncbi:MAG: YaaR family protein [Clostridia bacterium]|nr:YaaR family protein [Clostridia bacterium]
MIIIKIQEALNNRSNISGLSGKEERKVSDNKEVSFQNHIKRVEGRNYEDKIRELVDKITEQGDKLGKRLDIKELKVYKKLISEFLDEAVGNSHEFSKRNFLDRRGRHKTYAIVKKINENVEQLTKEVLSAEKDNINILQRLDDIRGLILDIVM